MPEGRGDDQRSPSLCPSEPPIAPAATRVSASTSWSIRSRIRSRSLTLNMLVPGMLVSLEPSNGAELVGPVRASGLVWPTLFVCNRDQSRGLGAIISSIEIPVDLDSSESDLSEEVLELLS